MQFGHKVRMRIGLEFRCQVIKKPVLEDRTEEIYNPCCVSKTAIYYNSEGRTYA